MLENILVISFVKNKKKFFHIKESNYFKPYKIYFKIKDVDFKIFDQIIIFSSDDFFVSKIKCELAKKVKKEIEVYSYMGIYQIIKKIRKYKNETVMILEIKNELNGFLLVKDEVFNIPGSKDFSLGEMKVDNKNKEQTFNEFISEKELVQMQKENHVFYPLEKIGKNLDEICLYAKRYNYLANKLLDKVVSVLIRMMENIRILIQANVFFIKTSFLGKDEILIKKLESELKKKKSVIKLERLRVIEEDKFRELVLYYYGKK